MQIPIIPHRGQKKPWNSIPRINWAHPLAGGLISYGYDAGSGPIDLVTGGQRTITNSTSPPFGGVKTSPYGTGLTSIQTASVTLGLYTLPGNASIESFVVSAPYSFACGLMLQATPPLVLCKLFSTSNSPTTSTPVFLGCSNATATDYAAQFSDVTAIQNSAAGAIKLNTFQTILGVALTSSTVALYVDGALAKSASGLNTVAAATTGVIPAFHGRRNLSGQTLQTGFIYYGALWKGRALTASEARLLHDNPYCFLIYPEDEMFAENVGLTTTGIFPLGPSWEPQPLQTKIVTYG